LLVPATVTVSAGSSSSNYFSLTAVDDVIFDGTQSVTLTASAATFVNASKTLTIQDNDVLSLSVTLPPALSEGAGTNAGQGTVSIGVETASLIDVALASSSPARLSIPASVSIAPGQSSATFALSPIDDRIADGTVDETIVAHVAAEMVKRYLDARGPNDPIREEAGPFAETWGQGQGAALVLTDDDCALLAPTGPRRPRTINLGLGIPAP